MGSSCRRQTCDKRRTSLEQSLYTGQLTGLEQERKFKIEYLHLLDVHQMYVNTNLRHFARCVYLASWIMYPFNSKGIWCEPYPCQPIFCSLLLILSSQFILFQFKFFFKGSSSNGLCETQREFSSDVG